MSNKDLRGENMQFETEVSQILNLVIHSLYSNKEIFLRELVSNASDANDKLRFLAINNDSLYESEPDLKIRISFDSDDKTITISDNGVGMSKEEVIDNLGTIAKSGTKEFLQQLTGDAKKDSHLIGQFGVGFYSAFIIADSVTVRTRKAGLDKTKGVAWESTGENNYQILDIEKESRGTDITLKIKATEEEFLNDYRLKSIIKKYSDHIAWPIEMLKASEEKDKQEYEVVNKAKAMWTLPKQELSDEDYKEFYKHIAHDIADPVIWSHSKVEGKTEYTSLLYVPTNAPYDINNREKSHGLHLYVQRVFIMDNASQFLPSYLRFIKGLIDSNDLPLNISREILQTNHLVNTIKTAVTKKSIQLLGKLANDKQKYAVFWREFGHVLREGIVEDFSNKEEIAKLLRFKTTKLKADDELSSFEEYLSGMSDKQDKIYFITGNSYNAAKNSPHLEIFNEKGIEVILFTDRIDEWVVSHLEEFSGKKLQSVTHGELPDELLDNESEKNEKDESSSKNVCDKIKNILSEKVKDVRESKRLTSSPACLVAEKGEMSQEMLRLLQASGQPTPNLLPILEINIAHPIIKKITSGTNDADIDDWTSLVYEQAVLAEGGALDDPGRFVSRLNKLLVNLDV